jgi:hypothetical protein
MRIGGTSLGGAGFVVCNGLKYHANCGPTAGLAATLVVRILRFAPPGISLMDQIIQIFERVNHLSHLNCRDSNVWFDPLGSKTEHRRAEKDGMMVALCILQMDIHDMEAFKDYIAKAPQTVIQYGGRHFSRGG